MTPVSYSYTDADIEAMPMGMYTLVGEGVSTLSGAK